jgi:TP901 family phage tail tape measure protein
VGVRSITVYVLGDGTGLTRVLNQGTIQIDRFVADAEKKGNRVGAVLGSGLVKGAALAGTGLALALGAATVSAVPFEAAMRNVGTISADVRDNFDGTSKAVLDLSQTVPQAATTLAKGLYEIVSSNFQGADAFHVLEVSAKAASAGLTDTDTASRAITGALNAYGLSAASAGDVSDILFQTVNKGVVTFGDLAQQLGDFVGIAAAAKVPLQDVASAYAAITLAGVPAAEAATSTNQLLTKLIKPTKDLAALYQQLGYESGASALQQKGLAEVIREIGKATGGSAETLVRMFNDVRAARGVLALLSADGKNYQAAIDGITDTSQRAGATQRAFAEQMKSTQAQLQLFGNSAEAFGISIGLKVLPAVNAFLAAARQAGGDAVPFLEAALNRVGPVFEQVWVIAGNLAKILLELARDAAPFAQALAAIAGAVVVAPLLLFLRVLSSITGFLADHKEIVEAVAAVYLARFIPGLVAAGAQMVVAAARTVYLTVTTAAYVAATDGAAAATTRLGSVAGLTSIAMTAGLAAAIFAVTRGMGQWNDAQDQAAKKADDVRKAFDAYDTGKAEQQLAGLAHTMQHSADVGQQYTGVWGAIKAGFSEVAGDGSIGKIAADGEAASKAYAELTAKLQNTQSNLAGVARITGYSSEALGELAKRANIDLSGTYDSSADARRRLINYVQDLKKADEVTAVSIAANAGMDVDAMKALQDAIEGAVKAATGAFTRDTDVLGSFDPGKSAQKVADAQKALTDARKQSGGSAAASLADEQRIARDRQRIRDAEARADLNTSKSARSHLSDQQSIARARQSLADDEARIQARAGGGTSAAAGAAAQRLAQARAEAANSTLEKSYKRAVKLGEDFTRDINAAIQRGLDPNVVARLLEEGPAKAEPVLQSILADHSGHMIRMVNESETQLAKLSGFVAEQARIAAVAMNAPTDDYTRDLKKAMAIAAREAASGGKATVAQLARSLRIGAGEVAAIAHKFGITLADEVQAAVNRHPIYVNAVGKVTVVDTQGGGGRIQKPRAEGGPIDWGPFGRDQVPALLTRREFVQPKASVDYYGLGFHEAVRTRTFPKLWDGGKVTFGPLPTFPELPAFPTPQLPKFWEGGLVDTSGTLVSSVLNVAGPRIVPVAVPVANRSSTDNSQTWNIDRVVVGSLDQLPSATGGRTYSAMRGVS